jgi:hypothetical protein
MRSVMQAHVIVDRHTGEITVEGYEYRADRDRTQIREDCANCQAALARGEHPLMLVPADLDDEVTVRDIEIDETLAQLLRDELEESSVRQRARWRTGTRRRRR